MKDACYQTRIMLETWSSMSGQSKECRTLSVFTHAEADKQGVVTNGDGLLSLSYCAVN